MTPHPPIIVPEVGREQAAEADATVRAMQMVGERTAALAPDTIVLLSPHAPLVARKMGVSLAFSYRGTLAYFRAPEVAVRADGDEDVARGILERAAAHGIPVAVTASPEEKVDLDDDHGATVPLVFLLSGLQRPCRLVLLAFSQLGLEDHIRFGGAVGEALLSVPERVVYVASGDLSHRLLPEGPYGFDARGVEFDRLVADTFGRGDWEGLLSIEPDIVAGAGECGYRSLAVLSGVVAAAEARGMHTQNHVLSHEGPFGVGYLVGEVTITEASEKLDTAR